MRARTLKNILYLVIATPQCVHNSGFQLSVSCGKFSGYSTLVIVLLVLSHLMPMQASFPSNAHGAFSSFSQCSISEHRCLFNSARLWSSFSFPCSHLQSASRSKIRIILAHFSSFGDPSSVLLVV